MRGHAGDVLAELASRGTIPSVSTSALGIDAVDTLDSYLADMEGVMVSAKRYDGGVTADIFVACDLSPGRVVLVVQPERNHSYAVLKEDASSQGTVLDPSVESTSLEPQGCLIGQVCALISCEPTCDCGTREVYCCEDGSCYFGDTLDSCSDGAECYTECCVACGTC